MENIRSVCTGEAVIVNVIKKFRFYEGRAMAELDGIDDFQWWLTNLEGLVRIVRAAGFERVETHEHVRGAVHGRRRLGRSARRGQRVRLSASRWTPAQRRWAALSGAVGHLRRAWSRLIAAIARA